MKKRLSTAVEILFSLAFVGFLLWVGLTVKPKEPDVAIELPLIEKRDRFYGVAKAPDNEKILWAVGKEGKVLKSEDGGKSWQPQSMGSRLNLQDIAAWDSQKAVMVGNEGAAFYTEDGGKTWVKGTTPKSEIDNKLFRVKISPSGQAVAVGVMGAVFASDDFGKTWQRIAPEEDIAWNDIAFIGNTIWVAGEFGHLKYTQDGGITWMPVKSETDRSLMAITFRDEMNAMAVGLEGTMIQTTDGGVSWTALPQVTAEHLFEVQWWHDRWFVVGDRGLMVSGNTDHLKAAQLSEMEFGWHTEIEPTQEALLIAGSSLGSFEGNEWHIFKAGEK